MLTIMPVSKKANGYQLFPHRGGEAKNGGGGEEAARRSKKAGRNITASSM